MHDYLFDQESCEWVHWTATVPAQELPASLTFNEIIVQTIDTVRYSYLMRLLITHGHHTLFTGVKIANIHCLFWLLHGMFIVMGIATSIC